LHESYKDDNGCECALDCQYLVGDDGHDYPHTEGRFYCFPSGVEEPGGRTEAALEASRSARFGVYEGVSLCLIPGCPERASDRLMGYCERHASQVQ
jgi:hypothetical protein